MDIDEKIDLLKPFISDRRNFLIRKVLNERTRHVTVVLEDIYQPQNASAVLRTCECLGVQDIHIIENRYVCNLNPRVVMGSTKWLSLNFHRKLANNTRDCLQKLKQNGYRIFATSVSQGATPFDKIEIDRKIAFVFGTELTGISEIATEEADDLVTIPMYGFTESYNLSVSVAMVLQDIITRLKRSSIDWRISPHEKMEIELDWLKKIVRRSDLILKEAGA